jgi:hypothetical protein
MISGLPMIQGLSAFHFQPCCLCVDGFVPLGAVSVRLHHGRLPGAKPRWKFLTKFFAENCERRG